MNNRIEITRKVTAILFIQLLMMAAPWPVCGQAENGDQAKSTVGKPTIAQFAWIAGHWKGKAMGGDFEETWNPPMAGRMMGMFQFVKEGKVVFYEILTIVPKGDSFVLRLKHFDSKLVGWEEKDKSVEFPLIRITNEKAEFDGLVFYKQKDGKMKIVVTTKSKGKVGQLTFPCQKVKAR